jgi:hypothetical protein
VSRQDSGGDESEIAKKLPPGSPDVSFIREPFAFHQCNPRQAKIGSRRSGFRSASSFIQLAAGDCRRKTTPPF